MVNKVLCVYQSTETMTRDKITSNIILTLHLQSSKNILLNDASSNLHCCLCILDETTPVYRTRT